jgi:ABC-type lipoprotein release transport system permease subunit
MEKTVALPLLERLAGIALAAGAGSLFEALVKGWVPLAPAGTLLVLTPGVACSCLGLGLGAGLLASLYPAWEASRLHPAVGVRAP